MDCQRAVPLVRFVPAVDLVVTDQLGVHTGAVVTTEVTGLLHCQVEVERSVLRLSGVRAVVCRDGPQVLPHRHSQSLVDVSPCLVCELVSYLPAPPLLGVGQLRLVDADQQVRADLLVGGVQVETRTQSRQSRQSRQATKVTCQSVHVKAGNTQPPSVGTTCPPHSSYTRKISREPSRTFCVSLLRLRMRVQEVERSLLSQ